jgi:hypothetical protein
VKAFFKDSTRIPDLILERYRLGEISPAEKEYIRCRLATDMELQARLQTLELSDEDIRKRYPAGWLAERVRQQLEKKVPPVAPSAVPRRFYGRWSLAAAALVLLGIGWHFIRLMWIETPEGIETSVESVDRLKGDRLVLFRKTREGSEVLSDSDRVRPGDQIRIGYRAAGPVFGVIFSVDGHGTTTLHLPSQGEQAALLDQKDMVLLDQAFELDDTPGWEQFYLVSADRVFDITPLLASVRRAAKNTGGRRLPAQLPLPASFDQSSFILYKEPKR